MYLLALPVLYIVAYLILFFGIPLFFGHRLSRFRGRSVLSIISILILYFAALFLSFSMSYPELTNRVLHAVGGGSLIVFTYFLAAKDSKTNTTIFQFLVMSISLATVFGVGNEIIEYVLQNHFGLLFVDSINDTWLDLISNTIGASVAAGCLAHFVKKGKK